MLDFFYFMNFSVITQTTLFPSYLLWFKVSNSLFKKGLYIKNILVELRALNGCPNACHCGMAEQLGHPQSWQAHIHLHPCLPTLTLHLYRWGLILCSSIHPDDTMSLYDLTVLPLILYAVWQVGYLLATEVMLAEKIRNNRTIVNSLRYHMNGFYTF